MCHFIFYGTITLFFSTFKFYLDLKTKLKSFEYICTSEIKLINVQGVNTYFVMLFQSIKHNYFDLLFKKNISKSQ